MNTKIVLAVMLILGSAFFGFRLYRHFHPHRLASPPPRPEVTLTIIPGWNLRQVAEYLVLKGIASSTEAVYHLTGKPAFFYAYLSDFHLYPPRLIDARITQQDAWSGAVSYEGYLAPETYRIFSNATLPEVFEKFIRQRDKEITPEMYAVASASKKDMWQILTMASIVEKEVKHDEDRAKVADILWRRLAKGWALQVDSSVHYAIDKTGDVFTTDKEREVDSPWNTYKYSGLPPGPICNPGLPSIKAALYPQKNEYWYFLSGRDGKMYYGKTLEEHNRNKKYL